MSADGTVDAAVVDAVVIGGGIAGLVVAWELAGGGLRPALLEAGDHLGGAVRSHRVAGLELDAGAESFAGTPPDVRDLIADLGLAADIVEPAPAGAWVRHAAGTAPLPAAALLGIPGYPWAGDARRVIGLGGAIRSTVDRVLPARSLGGAGVTLGAAVRRRLGRRVLDRLVEPVAGGVYSADPGRLELRAVAPRLLDAAVAAGSLTRGVRAARPGGQRPGSAVGGLSGGMHRIPAALAAGVTARGGSVQPGRRATRVASRQGVWEVVDATGDVLVTRRVVLAVPLAAASTILAESVPEAFGVQAPPVADVLLCTLVLDDARLDAAPRGTGVLVAAAARGVRAKALTHATAKWPWLAAAAGQGRHVLRLSYGRAGDPGPPMADLERVALADATTLLGVPLRHGDLVESAAVRWAGTLGTFPPGHVDAVRRARAALAPRGVWLAGSGAAGTGLAAVVADARAQAAAVLTGAAPATAR